MQRDMDLVRSILMDIEQANKPLSVVDLDNRGHSQDEVIYHVELMAEKGLIDARITYSWGKQVANTEIKGLTWDGQDFLDAMRDERVWNRAKKVIFDAVGSTTFGVIKETCSLVALKIIKSTLES